MRYYQRWAGTPTVERTHHVEYQKPATERVQIVGQLVDHISIIIKPCDDCQDPN